MSMGCNHAIFREREVAQLIAYLASPQAASVTGADFLIDGGLVKTA